MKESIILQIDKFKRINNISGWLVFLIAAITYLLTIEPSASFWDCGEFITDAYKLEVGHPPGAPLFMILGRFFTFLAGGDVTLVAKMVNVMSALASAFTILFLFWSITHIVRRILAKDNQFSLNNLIVVIGSGLVGALVYTFSDSFWFSAVEGEVYATSSLFTAVVFWAILKWENEADEKYANRWIILIAYLMGLSIGVHLLNLLAIPAIVFVYYFKKYEITTKGVIIASLLSVFILGFTMYGIVQGFVVVASKFELIFTNTFGLPFNVGSAFYLILVVGGLIYGIYLTRKYKKVVLDTIFTAMLVILIGYSSFAIIVIRSLADTPMNQNSPNNMFALLSYLNREQYGENPLIHGQYFNAPVDGYDEGKPVYIQKEGQYVAVDHQTIRNFAPEYTTIFPRMYSDSQSPEHVKGYQQWTGTTDDDFYNVMKDEKTGEPVLDRYGDQSYDYSSPKRPPTFAENMKYFFSYQVNFMYMRYFMWNFAGRQNDIQGNGNVMEGNWISGITPLDELRLGNQDKITDSMKNNKARNKYYFLPLLLGILGIIFLLNSNREGKNYFWVVMLFFFFTGMAIVLYLNQPPFQPRERDYAYSGSFYAFAIFIGLGVAGIDQLLRKGIPAKTSGIIATIISLSAPIIMANQNWDDHDRSGRNTARDYAKNYLSSCEKNAIIFTNGDNDTFPLWYIQEVEGYRTDVRVINLSYLNTDWYIDQMKKKAYNSEAVPFSLTHDKYITGKREIIYKYSNPNVYLDEKYETHQAQIEPEYAALFDSYFNFLKESGFDKKQKEDFDHLLKGHTALTPTQFYSLTNAIADKKNALTLGIDTVQAGAFRKSAETLLQKITSLPLPLKTLIKHIASDNEEDKVQMQDGSWTNYMPGTKFYIPSKRSVLKENNVLSEKDLALSLPAIEWDVNKGYIRKNDLMVLDLLASSDWKRPVYFAITVGGGNYLGLENYFQLEGLAFKVVPIRSQRTKTGDYGRINSDILYDNLMNKFVWGGIETKGNNIYLDENNRRFLLNFKNTFGRLAEQLISENKNDKAEQVLDKCVKIFTNEVAEYGYYDLLIADLYYKLGKAEKANKIMQITSRNVKKEFEYYLSLKDKHLNTLSEEMGRAAAIAQEVMKVMKANKQKDMLTAEVTTYLDMLENKYAFQNKIQAMQANEQEFYAWYAQLPDNQKQIVSFYMYLFEAIR